MSKNPSKGIPIILSAPSGGGKTTIADALLKADLNVVRSISCTTRAPRGNEKDGVDYFFISKEEFQKKIKNNDFLEWAEVHENFYGTPKEACCLKLNEGKHVLFVIDPQGAVSLRNFCSDGLYIFVIPPTWETLEKRLGGRGTNKVDDMKVRLANAKKELAFLPFYDFLVVNKTLTKAIEEVKGILNGTPESESLRVRSTDVAQYPIFEGIKLREVT